jgi:hypothetical protein
MVFFRSGKVLQTVYVLISTRFYPDTIPKTGAARDPVNLLSKTGKKVLPD